MPTLRNLLWAKRQASNEFLKLPVGSKMEAAREFFRYRRTDPGVDQSLKEAINWLGRAQDFSTTKDGGVAHSFSLISGWNSSYPETTGYIIPTLVEYARLRNDGEVRARARRMLDWLVSIQLPSGAFQGGRVDSVPVKEVTFNTGQILMGLVTGVAEFGEAYREPMRRAADWLVKTQDPDGCWRNHPSPFAVPGEKTYDTHVAWGLLLAARVDPGRGYAASAHANVRWALQYQNTLGWIDHCCLSDRDRPLTHTLGYALRGLTEAWLHDGDVRLLRACQKMADGLCGALRPDGFLPGRLDARWRARTTWACLTGSVQIASCWLLLYERTGNERYRQAAQQANAYVRTTMTIDGEPNIRGGVKGSYPSYAGYGRHQYLNWAVKFAADAFMLENRFIQPINSSP